MKKQFAVAMGLAVLSTSAFATKARLGAFGENVSGSWFIDDNRNIFLNPAQVNNQKDFATFELGQNASAMTNGNSDSVASPSSEGGFVQQMGGFVAGAHFGSVAATSEELRGLVSNAGNNSGKNSWDLFFGGDAGMQWGANVSIQSYSDDTVIADGSDFETQTETSKRTALKFGMISGPIEAALHYGLNNTYTNGAEDEAEIMLKGKSDMMLGAAYTFMEDWKAFFEYKTVSADVDNMTSDFNSDIKGDDTYAYSHNTISLGAGRFYKVNNNARFFNKVSYVMDTKKDGSQKNEDGTATNADDWATQTITTTTLPVVLGVEATATSWLTVRGSITHNVMGTIKTDKVDTAGFNDEDGVTKTQNNTNTTVAAGATLNYGELTVDGLVGNDNTASGTGANGTTGGVIRLDSLMSRVAVSYKF